MSGTTEGRFFPPELLERAGAVDGLILDVDGTMTDGTILIGPAGEEYKAFDVKDGLGIRLAMEAGVVVAVISGRAASCVSRRAADLGIEHVYQGIKDKTKVLKDLAKTTGIRPKRWACVGDDLLDLPLMHAVGLAVGVADCAPELIPEVHYRTGSPGGRGAVREVCELLLAARKARRF